MITNDNRMLCEGVINLIDNKNIPLAGIPNFSELVQTIMEEDEVYTFLIYYFLEWISD